MRIFSIGANVLNASYSVRCGHKLASIMVVIIALIANACTSSPTLSLPTITVLAQTNIPSPTSTLKLAETPTPSPTATSTSSPTSAPSNTPTPTAPPTKIVATRRLSTNTPAPLPAAASIAPGDYPQDGRCAPYTLTGSRKGPN